MLALLLGVNRSNSSQTGDFDNLGWFWIYCVDKKAFWFGESKEAPPFSEAHYQRSQLTGDHQCCITLIDASRRASGFHPYRLLSWHQGMVRSKSALGINVPMADMSIANHEHQINILDLLPVRANVFATVFSHPLLCQAFESVSSQSAFASGNSHRTLRTIRTTQTLSPFEFSRALLQLKAVR